MAVRLALLLHLALALGLVLHGPRQHPELPPVFAVGAAFAQASLLTLWAAARAKSSALRFAVAAAAAAWGWFVAIAVLPGIGIRSPESAGWAAGLAAQAVVILGAASAWRVGRRLPIYRGARGDGTPTRSRLQYDLASLLAWTAVVAVLLGVGKTACALLGWNRHVTEWTYFRFLPVLGVFNGAYAVLVALSLVGKRRIAARLLAASLILVALACLQPYALVLLFGTVGGLGPAPALMLAGSQAALLYLTLLPVRVCQWRAERSPAAGSTVPPPRPPGPGLETP